MPRTSGTRPKGNGSGKGPGWGGPEKGEGSQEPPQPPFEEGNQAAKGYHDMSRSERIAALQARLWTVGMGHVPDMNSQQISAAVAFQNREEGMPVRSVNVNATVRRSIRDFSDEELAVLAGEGGGAEGVGGEGSGAE